MNFLAQQAEKEIVTLHEEIEWCLQSSLDKAIEIGERLSKAKEDMSHGEFGKWVEEKLPFSARSATRYIRAFTHVKTLNQPPMAVLTKFIDSIKVPKKPIVVEPKEPCAEPIANIQENIQTQSQTIMDTDAGGMVIPEILAEIFRVDGLEVSIEALRTVKKDILLAASVNPRYKLVKTNPFTIDIDNCIRALKFAIPTHVCRYCSGSGEKCACCKGSGWINQTQYDNTAEELK